jgi:hypothetical protein
VGRINLNIGIVFLGARVEGGHGHSFGLINIAEASFPKSSEPQPRKIVVVFDETKGLKLDGFVLNGVNHNLGKTERLSIWQRGFGMGWDGTAADYWRERDRGVTVIFWDCWKNTTSIRDIQTANDRRAMSAVLDFEPKFQLLVGAQSIALEVGADRQEKGSLALNKRVSLYAPNESKAQSEGGHPPSEPNHSVWVAERLFSKPLLRFCVLLATFALGITALEILFSPHASSLMSAISVSVFFGLPIIMLFALLWLN